MNTLYFTVGLPRSGKTTLINKILEKDSSIVIVSADSIRFSLYGQRYYQPGESHVWATRETMLRELLKQKKQVIIDETNTTMKRRLPITLFAKEYNYNCIGFWIDTSKEICIKRAEKENDNEIIPIIEKMSEQFQNPTLEENFNVYHIENNDYSIINSIFKGGIKID